VKRQIVNVLIGAAIATIIALIYVAVYAKRTGETMSEGWAAGLVIWLVGFVYFSVTLSER
jgi:hypothetical protein